MNNEQLQTTDQEQENADVALIPATDVQGRIDMMLANREYIVEKVKPMLIEGVDVYTLPGMKKQSLGKPGAEKLAAIFGLTAKFTVDKETMDAMGAIAGKKYIAYVCNLSSKGRVAGQGRGAHFIEEMRENYRMVFSEEWERIKNDLKESEWKGPLQGTSKSSGKPYTYWKVKDNPVFDPLAPNKAIKMAQKSAFVDAVIRTTGMSDLFTQDLEDMHLDQQSGDESKPETPAKQDGPSPIVNPDGTVDDPFKDEPKDAKPVKVPCNVCGRGDLVKKNSKRGPFMGCTNYPACRNTRDV